MAKDRDLLQLLHQIGLAEKEAQVYYAALTLGPSAVSAIARQAGVKRTTTYSVIESLRSKRLLRLEVIGVKELWVAEDPQALRMLVDEQQDALAKALPKLSALHSLEGAESVIKYYDGLDAVKGVYLEMLERVRPGEDYMVLSDMAQWQTLDRAYFHNFLEQRAKLNIRVRMALTDSEPARNRAGPARKANEETRILTPGTHLTTNLVIIPRRVFVHQLVEPIMGMVIENEHIIRMHREMYELIWAGLKPVSRAE